MSIVPLVFTFRVTVFGARSHFAAFVTARGHALLVDEGEDGWWVYGVHPGGIDNSGRSSQEALDNFRTTFQLVMFDCATETGGYNGFKKAVERMFEEKDDERMTQWHEYSKRDKRPKMGDVPLLPEIDKDSPGAMASLDIVRLDTKQFSDVENTIDAVQTVREAS